ncbi:hypothetical protein LCGC14_1132760 [marine sediment metagenome]|uniref:Uncharacterized protein n=1 Tax=marine sediment metagenome TaxID=412755 RepID=A0A0F9PIW7_9ZZZZ
MIKMHRGYYPIWPKWGIFCSHNPKTNCYHFIIGIGSAQVSLYFWPETRLMKLERESTQEVSDG